jgi:hypothetical protein
MIFKGGCRCGGIQYTSTEAPSDIVLCHCRACQQFSGSGFLPFISVAKDALQYTKPATIKTLKLSDVAERAFCSSCGAPVTMVYAFESDRVHLTMSSTDPESFKCELPKVNRHIYLREKAHWVVLPDDGAERWGTSEFAHLIEKAG